MQKGESGTVKRAGECERERSCVDVRHDGGGGERVQQAIPSSKLIRAPLVFRGQFITETGAALTQVNPTNTHTASRARSQSEKTMSPSGNGIEL